MQVLCVTACGKKGPPRPPGYLGPPVVSDLRYQIKEDDLVLEWTVQEPGKYRKNDVAGAKVYRFKTPGEKAACKDCPVNLSFVASIPFKLNPMSYEEKIEKGFQYIYRVVLYDSQNQEGQKSNIVDFSYK
jgi:hypothetical protein